MSRWSTADSLVRVATENGTRLGEQQFREATALGYLLGVIRTTKDPVLVEAALTLTASKFGVTLPPAAMEPSDLTQQVAP